MTGDKEIFIVFKSLNGPYKIATFGHNYNGHVTRQSEVFISRDPRLRSHIYYTNR
jgi:hypothetical protein